MCGIFACIDNACHYDLKQLEEYFKLIDYRGPDSHTYPLINIFNKDELKVLFGFHRLAINGLDPISDQPLYHPHDKNIAVICNGEIYNYKKLIDEYKFDYKSHSDCEIIVHLYKQFGIEKTVELLDGEFAFVIIDKRDPQCPLIITARDPIGVRPLYIAYNKDKEPIGLCSELGPLHNLDATAEQFPPGHFMVTSYQATQKDQKYLAKTIKFHKYFNFGQSFGVTFSQSEEITETEISTVRSLLTDAVDKRLMSDRKVGLFISGGVDSSGIGALAAKASSEPLHSFAIALADSKSSDLIFAKKVADHIGTIHHEVTFTIDEGLVAIYDVIRHLASYDTTTVRASTPMYILSKWIEENTDIRVLLTGEGPDEALGGYLYFHLAPSLEAFQKETEDRVNKLYLYDLLRGDRSTAARGLEVRLPYLDKALLNYVMNLNPKLKHPKFNKNIEKYILRKALDDSGGKAPHSPLGGEKGKGAMGGGLLPPEVLWRPKEAFSDGVGRSWKDCIIKYAESKISDDLFEQRHKLYPINTPRTKEDFLYRQIYVSMYGDKHNPIPEFWMPKWIDAKITDPSATVLDVYTKRMTDK